MSHAGGLPQYGTYTSKISQQHHPNSQYPHTQNTNKTSKTTKFDETFKLADTIIQLDHQYKGEDGL